jgi:Zn-dependent protease
LLHHASFSFRVLMTMPASHGFSILAYAVKIIVEVLSVQFTLPAGTAACKPSMLYLDHFQLLGTAGGWWMDAISGALTSLLLLLLGSK